MKSKASKCPASIGRTSSTGLSTRSQVVISFPSWQKARILGVFSGRALLCKVLLGVIISCFMTACSPSPQSTAEKNALTAAQRLIKNGREYEQNMGLREAIARNYVAVTYFYVKEGVRIPNDAMTLAAGEGHLDMVELLCENGGEGKDLALYAACKFNHFKVAKYLLKQGAAPCMQEHGKYCLYWAVKHKDKKLAAALLDADQLKYSEGLAAPLAAEQGDYSMLEFLIKRGCSSKAVDLGKIINLPHMNKKILKLLVKGGTNLNQGLIAAVKKGCFARIKDLVELGADVQIKERGWALTSLTIDRDILNFLLAKGVKPVIAENDTRIVKIPFGKINDSTALQWIQLLIRCGANPKTNYDRGRWLAEEFNGYYSNPEDYYHITNFAAKYGFNQTLNYIFEKNYAANLDYALKEAIHYKHRDTAKLLISKYHYKNDIVKILDPVLIKFYVKKGGNLNDYVLYCLTDKAFTPRTKNWENLVVNAVTEVRSIEIAKLFEQKEFDIAMRLMPKVKTHRYDNVWDTIFPQALTYRKADWVILLLDRNLVHVETWKEFAREWDNNKNRAFLESVLDRISRTSKSGLLIGAVLIGNYNFAEILLSKGADPLYTRDDVTLARSPNVMEYVKCLYPPRKAFRKRLEECARNVQKEEQAKRSIRSPEATKKQALTLLDKGDYSGMFDILIPLKDSNDLEIQALLGISMVMTFKDIDNGFKLVQKSAMAGSVKGQLFMGIIYKHGLMKTVKPDRTKAVYWLQKAAAQNDLQAIKMLKDMRGR